MARILSDSGSQGVSSGGGIPTPNWDALADIDAVGGVTRADVVPRIVDRLTSEALNEDIECKVYYCYSLILICNFYVLYFFFLKQSSYHYFFIL